MRARGEENGDFASKPSLWGEATMMQANISRRRDHIYYDATTTAVHMQETVRYVFDDRQRDDLSSGYPGRYPVDPIPVP